MCVVNESSFLPMIIMIGVNEPLIAPNLMVFQSYSYYKLQHYDLTDLLISFAHALIVCCKVLDFPPARTTYSISGANLQVTLLKERGIPAFSV